MKKILTILIGITLLFSFAFANDGSLGFGEFGKTVYPIDNNNIRMLSEYIDVYVDVDAPSLMWPAGYVECIFVFQNTTDQTQTVLMGFPGQKEELTPDNHPYVEYNNTIGAFTTKINGKDIDIKKVNGTEENPYSYWYTWEVTFAPNETITINNTYNVTWNTMSDAYGSCTTFGYIITTGKEWKDTIGETTVNFHLGEYIKSDIAFDPYMTDLSKKHITISKDVITFNRKDFEPEEDLSFDIYDGGFSSDLLYDCKISINPGHQLKGNTDLEEMSPLSNTTKAKITVGTNGESELNLKISKNLNNYINNLEYKEDNNFSSTLVRDKQDVNISNKERALLMNKSDFAINIHCNGIDNASISGTEIIIPAKENLYNKEVYEASKTLANNIKEELEDMYRFTSEAPKGIKIIERNDLTTLNWSDVPTVIIECGYLTNENDKAFINELANPDSYISEKFFKAITYAIDRSSKIENKTLTEYLTNQNNAPALEVIATSSPEDATITETIPQKQFPIVPITVAIIVILITGTTIVLVLRKKKNTVEEKIENDNKKKLK